MSGKDSEALARRFAAETDQALQAGNAEYRAKRADGQLGAPVPWLLAPGSLARWQLLRIAAGADEAQLKPPGLQNEPGLLAELAARALAPA